MEAFEFILTEWIIDEKWGIKETSKNSSCTIDQILLSQMDRLI